MTAETLKPFIKLPLASDLKKEKGSKGHIVCYSIILSVFYVGLLGFVVWNSIRIANLQKEVNTLNLLIDNIQKRLGLDLLADLDEFEEAYAHRGATGNQDKENEFFNFPNDDYSLDESDDSFEEDYRSDMTDDDEEDEDDYGSGIKDENLETSYEKLKHEIQDIMYPYLDSEDDLSISEESRKDKTRKTRAISSRSGVPVIEQPYSIRNNTENANPAQPTLKYDWNEKSTQQNLGRKHKKYMGSRRNHAQNTGNTNGVHQDRVLSRPDYYGQVTTKSPETYARPNRVMQTNEDKSQAFRQVITKSEFERMQRLRNLDKSGSPPAQVVLTSTRRRTMRPMHKSLEGSRHGMTRGRSIAVHYNGDTSRYATGHHEHYDGNGRLKHSGGVYTDWMIDPQLATLGELYFHMENGVVTVKDNGIYLLYAQIFYHDDHDTNGYVIEKNHEAFLQCTTMTHSMERVTKSNTCFTSGVTFLKSGDKIRVVDLGNHRYSLLQPSKSFFGLVKLGDGRLGGIHHRQNDEENKKNQISAEMRRLY